MPMYAMYPAANSLFVILAHAGLPIGRRGSSRYSVIARRVATWRSLIKADRDCFASLAMTTNMDSSRSLFRGIDGYITKLHTIKEIICGEAAI